MNNRGVSMNRSAKGSRKEKELMDLLKAHYAGLPGYRLIRTWKVHRSRAGGNDFLAGEGEGELGFDLALYFLKGNPNDPQTVAYEPSVNYLMLVQCKSKFQSRDYEALKAFQPDEEHIDCYLAVYAGAKPSKLVPPSRIFTMGGWVLYRA